MRSFSSKSLSFLSDPSNPVKPSIMNSACLVVDVIGEDFRSQLIDRYSAIELKEYRRIFRTSDEAGQLDNLSRRFAFFKRVLQNHDSERDHVFPQEWKVGQHLCAKFIDITRCVGNHSHTKREARSESMSTGMIYQSFLKSRDRL